MTIMSENKITKPIIRPSRITIARKIIAVRGVSFKVELMINNPPSSKSRETLFIKNTTYKILTTVPKYFPSSTLE
ncbi:hypothetical protein D3C78_1154720 [compost metagenome]